MSITQRQSTIPIRTIHRLIYRRYSIPANFALNDGPLPPDGMAPERVAADLRQKMNAMSAAAFDLEHGRVDYRSLMHSPVYLEYLACARLLRRFDLQVLRRREEQLSFWINLYNALIIDAVIQFGIRESVHETPGFFWRAAYEIGALRFCAYDIEYGILRANRGHPAIPGPQFAAADPRKQYQLAELDPRVHFALVCAARSCPPVAFYSPEKIDDQLDAAARSFINGGGVDVDIDRREVWLSRIFQWYAPDFAAGPLALTRKQALLDFVAQYLTDEIARDFLRGGSARVRFQKYDWSLNYAGI